MAIRDRDPSMPLGNEPIDGESRDAFEIEVDPAIIAAGRATKPSATKGIFALARKSMCLSTRCVAEMISASTTRRATMRFRYSCGSSSLGRAA